jgi:hypothetical protein
MRGLNWHHHVRYHAGGATQHSLHEAEIRDQPGTCKSRCAGALKLRVAFVTLDCSKVRYKKKMVRPKAAA